LVRIKKALKSEYFEKNGLEITYAMKVHDGVAAITVDGGDFYCGSRLIFVGTKDMRILRHYNEGIASVHGSVVFGVGEMWMIPWAASYLYYHGPSHDKQISWLYPGGRADTAFIAFYEKGLKSALFELQQNGLPLDVCCLCHGWTLLHHAAYLNSRQAIVNLVGMGLDVDCMSLDIPGHEYVKKTAAYLAAQYAKKESLSALIDMGADIGREALQYSDGRTRKIMAASYDPATLSLLLERKADVNGRDEHGDPWIFKAACDDGAQQLRLMCMAGADVNARNVQGVPFVCKLIENGLVTNGKADMLSVAFGLGCNINSCTELDKMTALMYAVRFGMIKKIETLVRLGSDVLLKNSSGLCALEMFEEKLHLEQHADGQYTFRYGCGINRNSMFLTAEEVKMARYWLQQNEYVLEEQRAVSERVARGMDDI
jgi:ankyrin repeat protein